MCIRNNNEKVAKLRQQMTILQLWKVVKRNDSIGIWVDTYKNNGLFQTGENVAEDYVRCYEYSTQPGAFHCTFTRKAARRYMLYRAGAKGRFKIIKVYARTANIVSAGKDECTNVDSISVSKMEIRSLQHQR